MVAPLSSSPPSTCPQDEQNEYAPTAIVKRPKRWPRDASLPRSCRSRYRSEGSAERQIVDRDESVRPDTTQKPSAALRPAFKKDGSVTAGNAPPVNDGASALVVMSARSAARLNLTPMARIVGQATSGLAPKYLFS